jgi:hypothetical protein
MSIIVSASLMVSGVLKTHMALKGIIPYITSDQNEENLPFIEVSKIARAKLFHAGNFFFGFGMIHMSVMMLMNHNRPHFSEQLAIGLKEAYPYFCLSLGCLMGIAIGKKLERL